jgi:hypothetical protein
VGRASGVTICAYPRDGFSRIVPSSGTPTDGSVTEFDTVAQVVRSLDTTEASWNGSA